MKINKKIISVIIIISFLPLLPAMASITSPQITERLTINGNVDLANQAIAKGWSGDGSAEDPYIIEDYYYNLATTHGFLINIENTDKYLIIRNCYAHAPMAGLVQTDGGFKFVNVKNVQFLDCKEVGSPYYLMIDGFPTYSALILENCENFTIDNFTVENFHNDAFHPTYVGIKLENCQNINITNSNIESSFPIFSTFSTNLFIDNNVMQASGNTPYPNCNHGVSIYFMMTNNSLISNNIILNYLIAGIVISNSFNNTIIENNLYSNYSTKKIDDNNPSENRYLSLYFPNNQDKFHGPYAPSPGHYSGSSYYTSGESFENRINDESLDDSLWISSGVGLAWGSFIRSSKIDSYGNEHKKIVECRTGISTEYNLKQDTTMVHNSGTVEFWFLKDASGSSTTDFSLMDQSSVKNFEILIENDFIKYTDGISTINTSIPIENDKWYRASIDYSIDGLYADLDSSQYRFRIFDSDGETSLFISPKADFQSFNPIRYFNLHTDETSGYSIYLDAIGHYWPDSLDSPGYFVGDNKAEGILLNYALQRFGIDYPRLGYCVNQDSYKYITWDLSSPFDPKYNKLVIPVPSNDGVHSISLFWASITGSPTNTLTKQFDTYYETHFGVSEYYENGVSYPPGTMVLADYDDLTVSLTYTTKDWYLQDTWTNASYYFKINNGAWMGPFVFNSGIGWQTANFTIGEGNYSIFDNLYYYVTLDQYDDSNYTNHLETYYLTQEPVALYLESEARENAFRKKISPIPYELTLNYSVFYQSQINAITSYVDEQDNVVNVTTFPFVDILYQNISLDYYNMTNALDEYAISCYNESLLNHQMESFASNINTSTSPLFSFIDEITSPFLLPTDMNFTTGTPDATHVKYLTIPAISFSYIVGHNLSFTGNLFNVTYQGTEMWPDANHKVLTFIDESNNFIIRYDSSTRIMVYFEYTNDTIINRMQKTTFVLIGNNASYPINVKIDWYNEIISAGVEIIPNQLLAIVYDPPGDHSFGQISSGTTITKGFSISSANTDTFVDEWKTLYFGKGSEEGLAGLIGDIAGVLTKIPVLGDILSNALPGIGLPPGQHEFSQSVTKGTTTDYEFSITYGSTFTSSLNNEDPELIGPGGGDLYYGTGMIIYWVIKHRVHYIDTVDASNDTKNQVKLWNGTNSMEYGLVFNSSFAVLGAYLDDYGLENLTRFNPFLQDDFNAENFGYLSKYQTDTLFWTPDYITELEYSTTESFTETYSFTVDVSKSDFYCWNQIVTGSASAGLGFIAEVSIGAGLNVFESSGRRGWSYEFEMSTISTTSTEENRQTIAHFEDDDGTPIGQHDQFGVQIYRDLRFNTFGYYVMPEFTYTSNPYEPNYSQDRRPPTVTHILDLDDYIGGNVLLQAIAMDDETGVNSVKIYYDNDPVFNPPDSEYLASLSQIDSESDLYEYLWLTNGLHGTYYLFIVCEDNSSNIRISNPYQVEIDNVLPEYCQLSAYGTYEGPISLYTSTYDKDSSISYVEYWDGDPNNLSSTLLGVSSDASTSYRYIWATDPLGSDDGIHYIYARAYDKAGNYLDSISFEMEVDTYDEPKKGSFIGFGSIFIVLSILTIYIRKKEKCKKY